MLINFRSTFSMRIITFFSTVIFFLFQEINAQENTLMNNKPDSLNEEVFALVQEMPRFPGCEDITDPIERSICAHKKMMNYINDKLRYPVAAKNDLVEGKVIVRFIVNTEGKIKNAEILRDIGKGCGKEVVRVIETMNKMPQKWIPGQHFGKKVNVYVNVPVEFKLTERWKQKLKMKNPDDLDLKIETVVETADEMPMFPGCDKITGKIEKQNCATARFIKYINANLKYPEGSLNKDFEGKVLARFIVRKDGYVSNIEILEDMEGGFGDEVKKVISSMNKRDLRWTPGKIKDKPVNVFISLPVNFKHKAHEVPENKPNK